ncbi:hypothetical protein MM440_06815 [Arsenicicoccus piscis]|uniref:CopG family transcriptional regulator n=1 Tax=Arsenicicoccus piscis TaxID=673954 RepID=A0ABQ6HUN8_9MICO|nr:hypothetical protein [Arsenicicoccus piscis]MCH8627502.1 hypothetical protein [Arsenicicoccus piscis]GMA21677.1 hypothetical protein GCM10025862_36980 [Arsenicicoccus piscis]
MATTVAPIKVSAATDELISHVAHFTGSSKKDVVELAVLEYIDRHRDEINAGVRQALATLDGSTATAVAALTGMTPAELDDLGGLPS